MRIHLKNTVLFQNIDEETIRKIETFTTEQRVSKDNIVFYEGDEPRFLYLLVKGVIKLYKTSSNHKEVVLKYFHDNELIGEVANFEGIPYPATAKAYSDVEVLKIDFDKLKDIIFSNPNMAFNIQTSLIKKIKNLENIISTNLVLDSKERVAKYIYNHADDFFETKNIEIAEVLGVSPETLSRILKFFKDHDIINVKSKYIDRDALVEFF
ncbi:MAG: Crp/Fnr family transcriptional regulator [Sulfurimonas sp. RIFOXYD12_FULL_33_39]|uniref:Crp/Fnr family transcriptional regulator n=1 Tax=unclassified Sulfurimonas TaxID=2623549 RepID=UPI0008B04A67|nr:MULTISPECIES: Crp/Fnr family transcriptional regulator [unclassified Sulfurimonas]OHE07820.1 MAG: Crp/Fnr family transcriptional regulator [Sulfurimonas sp. RIFCSPLOWO2_12_FULL_34_6]OHE10022.1 MAG: Crp/Fnr family transcriptional regulator [Sulfurimonas sp. RIFOXYD12_FULL_33_39]OHE14758.1 MAG: Crp/Fnr family transcriptional regulator [Sulfurimonas sp. RIFOXYD2_FULL_34_21]